VVPHLVQRLAGFLIAGFLIGARQDQIIIHQRRPFGPATGDGRPAALMRASSIGRRQERKLYQRSVTLAVTAIVTLCNELRSWAGDAQGDRPCPSSGRAVNE